MKPLFEAETECSQEDDAPTEDPPPEGDVAVDGVSFSYDGGAWQVGLENERGSIKVGKWTDFVLADKDVFDCPVTDIRKTKVVSTWFEGFEVYSLNVK